MAVPVFTPNQGVPSIFAWDAWPSPTKLYIYLEGCDRAELEYLFGRKNSAGTYVRGPLLTALRTGANFAAANDSIDMGTTGGFDVEEDTDSNSPYRGKSRLVITLSASAA